jgi:hypothetical protein
MMSNSTVRLNLSDRVVEEFWNRFGGNSNLSVTVNILLTVLLEEADLDDSMNLEETITLIREKLA